MKKNFKKKDTQDSIIIIQWSAPSHLYPKLQVGPEPEWHWIKLTGN